MVAGAAGCGGGERSDADEPEGRFPVEVTTAEFPTRQRLAKEEHLRIGVRNTGRREIPNLAVTLEVEQEEGGIAQGSFETLDQSRDLADRGRPVWVLEQGWPRLAGDLEKPGGALTAKTNTFTFGRLEPGRAVEVVWRLTPVRAGTWVLVYEIAAGPEGKARAVDETNETPRGTFQPTVSSRPANTRVDDAGRVVEQEPDDGSDENTGPGGGGPPRQGPESDDSP